MENGKYWYARTPERDAEFLRRFPNAENGRFAAMMPIWGGNTINFQIRDGEVIISPDGDSRDSTEFKPDVFPEGHWFVNTPENVAEFKKRFPATKFMYGESMDTFFEKRRDQCAFTYSMLVGGALAFCHSNPPQRTRFYFDNEKTKLDSAKVAEVFPPGYWLKNTKENVAEFLRRFPNETTSYGLGRGETEKFIKEKMPIALGFGKDPGDGVIRYTTSNYYEDNNWPRFYFDHELKPVATPEVAGEQAAKEKSADAELVAKGWMKHTGFRRPADLPENQLTEVILANGQMKLRSMCEAKRASGWYWSETGPGAITHYRPVKDEASTSPAPQPGSPKGVLLGSGIGVKGNSPFPESPLAISCSASGFRAPYLSWSSGGVPVSVSSSKESSMSISDSDVQRIAAAVIKMQSPATSSESTGPGIARRAGSFAWGATKGALGWAFAPAAKWAQTVVFLSAVVGLLLGSYKAYNTVRSIQLPSIVWPESSPSDVVSQPAPAESLTSWLNEQSGT